MKSTYIYPGSFCPPTFGHLSVLEQSAAIFPEVLVVCSTNNAKNGQWFTEEQCKDMWNFYSLPKNVHIVTLEEFKAMHCNPKHIVMIRGIRSESDMSHENSVMLLNSREFSIRNYFYVFSSNQHKHISSSQVRKLAEKMEIESLSGYVAPKIISKLLEKVLDTRHIFMVVGKPGSGKSTILNMFVEKNASSAHINTDTFSEALKPLIANAYQGEDFIQMARFEEEKLIAVIRESWIAMLKDALLSHAGKKHIFVEIPYGLRENKLLFRLIGGKVIYFGCENVRENHKRTHKRGTPELVCFINIIPGKKESCRICKKHNVSINCIDTSATAKEAYESLLETIERSTP